MCRIFCTFAKEIESRESSEADDYHTRSDGQRQDTLGSSTGSSPSACGRWSGSRDYLCRLASGVSPHGHRHGQGPGGLRSQTSALCPHTSDRSKNPLPPHRHLRARNEVQSVPVSTGLLRRLSGHLQSRRDTHPLRRYGTVHRGRAERLQAVARPPEPRAQGTPGGPIAGRADGHWNTPRPSANCRPWTV